MKRVKPEDFELFKTSFTKYQNQFGLFDYMVYFEFKPMKCVFATININEEGKVATAALSSLVSDDDFKDLDVVGSAKHECLHLLTYKLIHLAGGRYINEQEVDIAWEELVRRLERILP